MLVDAIRRAQREGDIALHVDSEDAAHAVLAGQLGLIVLGRVGQDPAALSITAETLLNGLLPKP